MIPQTSLFSIYTYHLAYIFTFLTVAAAPAISFFPTAVEPVKVIFLTWISYINQEWLMFYIFYSYIPKKIELWCPTERDRIMYEL